MKHDPKPLPNGAIECCCGQRYSPLGFADHLRGKAPCDAIGGVYLARGDTWRPVPTASPAPVPLEPKREQPAPQRPLVDGPEALSPERRAALVEAFYRQIRGGNARRCEGVSESSFRGLWPDGD